MEGGVSPTPRIGRGWNTCTEAKKLNRPPFFHSSTLRRECDYRWNWKEEGRGERGTIKSEF